MKKILHMTPGDVRSGVYRYIFNNLEYMDKKKYKHGFLTRAAAELVKSNEYNKYHLRGNHNERLLWKLRIF